MNLRFLCLVLFAVAAALASAQTNDPEDWFENRYAPLWEVEPWTRIDDIATFYSDTITYHPAGGAPSRVNSRDWLSGSINGWKAEGWVSSRLAMTETDRLNATTVVFTSKWLDVYADGSEEFSCGWYVSDLSGGTWSVSHYAEVDCASAGL